ncbi:hypothetical protein [Parageobacillus galactosidasius]|nr:hypothetical protein [Parageobacillus galactosidasius]
MNTRKLLKKREKEIREEVFAEITEQLKEMLTDDFEYVAPSETLSIRSNI